MLDGRWEIDTVVEQDRYGLIIYSVVDQKLTFSTVVTMAGVDTTVDITRTFLLLASAVSVVMYIMSYSQRCTFVRFLQKKENEQEAQLSQRDRAAACLNFGNNISAKSVHLTWLYVTALMSTNHHLLFYGTMFVLNAKLICIWELILEVFGGLNLVSLSGFLGVFMLNKSGLIF